MGRRDRRVRGDAGRAQETSATRGVRFLHYFCDDLSLLQVNGVAVFPDGLRVVSSSNDGTLKVWSESE